MVVSMCVWWLGGITLTVVLNITLAIRPLRNLKEKQSLSAVITKSQFASRRQTLMECALCITGPHRDLFSLFNKTITHHMRNYQLNKM